MKTKQVTMTPDLARRYLQKNSKNRPLSEIRVKKLMKEIKSGRWTLTHQGVCVSENGDLIDGQHRLTAIVRTNTPVDILLSTGANPDTFKFIDTGKNRTPSDIYKIEGFNNYKMHPSLAFKINRWNNKLFLNQSGSDVDVDSLMDITLNNYDVLDDIINELNKKEYKQKVYPLQVAYFVYWLLDAMDHELIDNYLTPLITGMSENARIVSFRNKLTDEKLRRVKTDIHSLVSRSLHMVLCCIEDKNKYLGDIQLETPYNLYDEIKIHVHRKRGNIK